MGEAARAARKGSITPTARLRLEHEGLPVFGPGPYELLRRVREEGSLHRAAQSMRMAYSKAWRIVHDAEEHLGVDILDRKVGGVAGGGSVLTPEGEELLRRYGALQDDLRDELSRLFAKRFGDLWPAAVSDREPGDEARAAMSAAPKGAPASETTAALTAADTDSTAKSAEPTLASGAPAHPARS